MKFVHFVVLIVAAIAPTSVATLDNREGHHESNPNSLRAHAPRDDSDTRAREDPMDALMNQVVFSTRLETNEDATEGDEIVMTQKGEVYPGDLCIGNSTGMTRDDSCTSRWCKYGRCTCFDDKHCKGSPAGPFCDCDRRSCVQQAKRGRLPGENYNCCPLECKYGGKDGVCDLPAGPCSGLDGGGWGIVRHVPSGNNWHPAKDTLTGTDEYGDISDSSAAWSIKYDAVVHDQFLFATGDCERWLVADTDAVIGENYENAPRKVIHSSEIRTSYTPAWYNRAGTPEDPWISITDHNAAVGTDFILYGENGFGNQALSHVQALKKHDGADVYIRKAKPELEPITITLKEESTWSKIGHRRTCAWDRCPSSGFDWPPDGDCTCQGGLNSCYMEGLATTVEYFNEAVLTPIPGSDTSIWQIAGKIAPKRLGLGTGGDCATGSSCFNDPLRGGFRVDLANTGFEFAENSIVTVTGWSPHMRVKVDNVVTESDIGGHAATFSKSVPIPSGSQVVEVYCGGWCGGCTSHLFVSRSG